MTDRPLLSIVFATYTAERLKDVFDLLESIGRQTYPALETLAVVDRTAESAALAGALERYIKEHRTGNVRVLLNDGATGANASRNRGIEEAKGEIVAVVDDDVVLFPDWAGEMVDSYRLDSSIAGVTGPAFPLWEDRRMSWFPRELYWIWGGTVWEWNEVREIRNVGGMNCSFRREVLLAAGLYDAGIGPKEGFEQAGWFRLGGDEVELSLRIRRKFKEARIIYNPKVRIYHKAYSSRFNWRFIAKKSFRFGYTKHYIKELFQADFSGRPVLGMEYDHLRHMLLRVPVRLLKEFSGKPVLTGRRFLTILFSTFFTGLGYCAYALRLVKKGS